MLSSGLLYLSDFFQENRDHPSDEYLLLDANRWIEIRQQNYAEQEQKGKVGNLKYLNQFLVSHSMFCPAQPTCLRQYNL